MIELEYKCMVSQEKYANFRRCRKKVLSAWLQLHYNLHVLQDLYRMHVNAPTDSLNSHKSLAVWMNLNQTFPGQITYTLCIFSIIYVWKGLNSVPCLKQKKLLPATEAISWLFLFIPYSSDRLNATKVTHSEKSAVGYLSMLQLAFLQGTILQSFSQMNLPHLV